MKKIILCGLALSMIISANAQKKCKTVKQTKTTYCKSDLNTPPPPPPPVPPTKVLPPIDPPPPPLPPTIEIPSVVSPPAAPPTLVLPPIPPKRNFTK